MAQIDDIARELEGLIGRLMVKVTLDVAANLKESTPVDTGWARANWVPEIGGRPKDPGDIDPTSQDVSAKAAEQSQAEAQVATTYRIERGSIFVSNGVKYITQLNDGSSRQAPSGFVQQGIKKAVTSDIKSFRG